MKRLITSSNSFLKTFTARHTTQLQRKVVSLTTTEGVAVLKVVEELHQKTGSCCS